MQDQELRTKIDEWCSSLRSLPLDAQVDALNYARRAMHDAGPFSREPVDCIQWVKSETVKANDYNPNSVATPEMELLRLSIQQDGYTQPIVAWAKPEEFEVVDGFHRNRVGKECAEVRDRINGYLPLAVINSERQDIGDRMASTIRHNRARGKHAVTAMSDIVVELKRRNWTDAKIAKNLGMDQDEVLRLTQISGIAELFSNEEFSRAWVVELEASAAESDGELLTDELGESSSGDRILHTWDKWECYKAGFHEDKGPNGMSIEEGEEKYREFLSDLDAFRSALSGVIMTWVNSCEHNLTNDRMNRIAWLGQAAMTFAHGVPAVCRGGYHRLTKVQQEQADKAALDALNDWLSANGRESVTMEQAMGRTQAELY